MIGESEPTWDERMEYTECIEDKEECEKCVKYPQCIRLKKCFDNKCNEDLIYEWIWVTKNEMMWEYEKTIIKKKQPPK